MVAFGLSPSEVDEVLAYFDCFALSERDPDMQGFLVRISALIVNICLAILIKWSDEDLESSVGVVFVQVYAILLATFISMNNKSLSISDSHFALVLTISPLAVYFVYASFRFVFMRRKPGLLYLRLAREYRAIIATSTFIMLALWIVLQLLVYFAREHVFNVQDHTFRCSRPTLKSWLFYRSVEGIVYLNWSYVLVPVVPALFMVYVLRHVVDIWREYKRRKERVVKWRFARWIQVPWSCCKCMSASIWIVVTHSHPWFFFLVVFTVYLSWAGAIGMPYLSMTLFYRYISDTIHFIMDRDPLKFTEDPDDASISDIFSFGQLLAGAAAIQPVYQVLRLAWIRRGELWENIKRLPRWVWSGLVYFFVGRENQWEPIRRQRMAKENGTGEDIMMYTPVHTRDDSRDAKGWHERKLSAYADGTRVFKLQSTIRLSETDRARRPSV